MAIDLNKLTKYTKFLEDAYNEQQWAKVKEEFKEVEVEYKELEKEAHKILESGGSKAEYKKKNIMFKAELLDLITASYNMLHMMGVNETDINNHCEKLDKYLSKGGKYGNKNN